MIIKKLVANRDGFEIQDLDVDHVEKDIFEQLLEALRETTKLLREEKKE